MHRLIAPLVAVALAGPALAADVKAGAIAVSGPWSRPAVAGGTGAGFLVIANTGKAVETLTAVESPVSRKVEIHRSSSAGGVMSMQKQASLPVPAGGAVTLAPGGYHLMFVGLTRAQKTGDSFPATLVFASGKRLSVTFKVIMGPPAAGAGHDMSKM